MSSVHLHPQTADRLAKLLGLLGSDHDGEVANAGRAADRLLRQAGLTWFDIIARPPQQRRDEVDQHAHAHAGPRHAHEAAWALQRPHLLTEWEKGFLGDLTRRHGPLSAKQRTCLDRILARLGARQGGAA